jgi:hypothetical protein
VGCRLGWGRARRYVFQLDSVEPPERLLVAQDLVQLNPFVEVFGIGGDVEEAAAAGFV